MYVQGGERKQTGIKNITANPFVTVQAGRKIYAAKARRVRDIDETTKITQVMFETGGD